MEGDVNKPHWINDLIKCPSQCFCSFWYEGIHYCIYLRWRHSDPWVCNLVRLDEEFNFTNDWIPIKTNNYSHDEYLLLQDEVIYKTKRVFVDIKFDEITTIND